MVRDIVDIIDVCHICYICHVIDVVTISIDIDVNFWASTCCNEATVET